MHEFAIGEELARAVLQEMQRLSPPPQSLCGVRVVVGCLRQVVADHLLFAFELFTRETPAEGASLEVISRPAQAACSQCGWNGELEGAPLVCLACGSPAVTVSGGMDLYLDCLEVEYDESE